MFQQAYLRDSATGPRQREVDLYARCPDRNSLLVLSLSDVRYQILPDVSEIIFFEKVPRSVGQADKF